MNSLSYECYVYATIVRHTDPCTAYSSDSMKMITNFCKDEIEIILVRYSLFECSNYPKLNKDIRNKDTQIFAFFD